MMAIRRRSIRVRVMVVAVLSSAVLFGLVAILMAAVLRWQLTDNLDEGLAQRADTIAAVVADTEKVELPVEEDLLIQVIDRTGKVQLASSNLRGVRPIAPHRAGYRTTRRVPGRDESFRVFVRPIRTPNGAAFVLVGINFDDVLDPVQILSRLLAVGVPAVLIVLGALTGLLTGRTLRPVERLRAELAEISATNLGRRVGEPNTGDEVSRLAHTMNETLDRLEDALRRQQRFVADASHELRGPLTRIRSELEVAIAHPRLTDPTQTAHSLMTETIGLQRLVEDLLLLARSDADATEIILLPVDLDDIVTREVRRLRERGRVTVDTSQVSAAHVAGDLRQLTRAVRNLFDNAERHAMSSVTVSLGEQGGTARLTVGDDGAGIAPEQRAFIFERFTRLDEARTRDEGGAGLGLAITRDIVQRHGGTVTLAVSPSTRFEIELPALP